MARQQRLAAIVLLAGLLGGASAQDRLSEPPAADAGPVWAPAAVDVGPLPAPPTEVVPPEEKGPPFRLEDLAWRKGPVRIVPFGVGIFNVNYNTRSLFQGSYSFYAEPNNVFNRSDFDMSPQNSFLGVDITGPAVGDARTSGRIDFDFRGPNPVETNATPYFFNIYGDIKTDRWRFVLGQAQDVISPLSPEVLNLTNGVIGYMPGEIGYFRAQARLELYFPIGEEFQFTWQGSINQQVVRPLERLPDRFGSNAGWPDFQGRLAWGFGPLTEGKGRPAELGVSAHIGERVLAEETVQVLRHYRTWSFNVDLRAPLTERLGLQAAFFIGELLGSYNGAIFQGIDPVKLTDIRAGGGWLSLRYELSQKLRTHVGYGIDDPSDHDLSVGRRSRNQAYWTNLFWDITPRLTWASEVSWWETNYLGMPQNSAARIETTMMYRF